MGKIVKKIEGYYAILYLVAIHVVFFYFLGQDQIDHSKPLADIILRYIGLILIYIISNICFLIPVMSLITISTIISFFAAISVPLFLFLSAFQTLGAEIDIMQYGFWESLLICILATPFGLMNLNTVKGFFAN